MEYEEQALVRQYPRCDYQNLYGEGLTGECEIWNQVRCKLFQAYKENIPDQQALGSFFQGVRIK